jgi:uncharacterized protein (DUF362 family)
LSKHGGDGGRRQFLRLLGLAGLGLAGCARSGGEDDRDAQRPAPVSATHEREVSSPAATVALVRCAEAVGKDGSISAPAVEQMVNTGVGALTGEAETAAAWGKYFEAGERVAVKVNCLSGPPVATHPEVTDAVAVGLQAAGVAPEDILIYDRLTAELETSGFTVSKGRTGVKCFGSDEVGYDDTPTTVKRVGTCFSRIVSEWCQAIVNVPVLKDHDLAGLTGALKNHYGSVHNPNKLHGQPEDRCSPYVADLNCAELLRSRERLIVYDALMVCYEGGPGHKPATTVPFGAIMMATDPVAADTVGLKLLDELRAEHGLEPLAGSEREPTYLAVAGDADHQLGCNDLAKITVLERVVSA